MYSCKCNCEQRFQLYGFSITLSFCYARERITLGLLEITSTCIFTRDCFRSLNPSYMASASALVGLPHGISFFCFTIHFFLIPLWKRQSPKFLILYSSPCDLFYFSSVQVISAWEVHKYLKLGKDIGTLWVKIWGTDNIFILYMNSSWLSQFFDLNTIVNPSNIMQVKQFSLFQDVDSVF